MYSMVPFEEGELCGGGGGVQRLKTCKLNFQYSSLWIYCLQMCLLAGIYYSPEVSTPVSFAVICGPQMSMCRVAKKSELPDTYLPSKPRSNRVTVTPCFTSPIVNKSPFRGCCHVFHTCTFCW